MYTYLYIVEYNTYILFNIQNYIYIYNKIQTYGMYLTLDTYLYIYVYINYTNAYFWLYTFGLCFGLNECAEQDNPFKFIEFILGGIVKYGKIYVFTY